MKILLSPAKKMRRDPDSLLPESVPALENRAAEILAALRSLSFPQLQDLWNCNDAIAKQNFQRLEKMDFRTGLTPAVLAYDGLAYQHMAPGVFSDSQFAYVQAHLRILSGFYGVLRPMDGIQPYRLEMQAGLSVGGAADLYAYWGRSLYEQIRDPDGIFLNLASKEYAKCIEKFLTPEDTWITCNFCQLKAGKPVQKATLAKMARGEMVRYLAEIQAHDPRQMQDFSRLGFRFSPEGSTDREYLFLQTPEA